MTPQSTTQQIRDIINTLISASLVNSQKYPVCLRNGKQFKIVIDGSPDLSLSLKSIPYEAIYRGLREAGAYHMQMIDGALIQMMYTFEGKKLLAHRLAYFPSPLLESYEQAAEAYNHEPPFAEIFSHLTIRAPIRLDFSSSKQDHIEMDHPQAHLTLGQQQGCRIPVSGPLTPFRFMRFILRSFYAPAYAEINLDSKALKSNFESTITDNEKTLLHVVG